MIIQKLYKIIVSLVLVCFILTSINLPIGFAIARELVLPAAGSRVHLSKAFIPPTLKGIRFQPDNPLRFEFVLDQGDAHLNNDQLREISTKLIKYFLVSLTIPEADLWVNLSPFEKDRIIPATFGSTEMGRDLLAEDYLLKQITASLIYPEDEIGRKFWKRIYDETKKQYGTTNVALNTFNKVWILPQKAYVYENAKASTAYVVESTFKVMLEEDYLSLKKHGLLEPLNQKTRPSSLASNIIREIIIPALTKEVNEGENFAQLRAIYNSVILAHWYKKKIKESILEDVYVNKNKLLGVKHNDSQVVHKIYQQYLQAFKKGVFNYIKEEIDLKEQQRIPRKYFSGGTSLALNVKDHESIFKTVDFSLVANLTERNQVRVTADLAMISHSPQFSVIPDGGKILAFGSSSTRGIVDPKHSYPALLERITGHAVINAGVPAERVVNTGHRDETKEDAVSRLPRLLEEHQPSLLIIWHGRNDLIDLATSTIYSDQTEKVKQGLERLIEMAKAKNCQVLLLGSRDPTTQKDLPVYPQVAKEKDVPYIEDFEERILGNEDLMFDKYHADSKGNLMFAKRIADFLWNNGALASSPNTSIDVPSSRKVVFQKYEPELEGDTQQIGPNRTIYSIIGFGKSDIKKGNIKVHVKVFYTQRGWSDRTVEAEIVDDFNYGWFKVRAILPVGVEKYILKVSYDGKPVNDKSKFWVWSNDVIKVKGDLNQGPWFTRIPDDGEILAFGSSSVKGVVEPEHSFPNLLEEMIGHQVINAGVPGERLVNVGHANEVETDGLHRLSQALDEHKPSLLVLWHGRNDWFDGKSDGVVENALRQMIQMAKDRNCQVLLLGAAKPGQVEDADVYSRIAQETDIPYLRGIGEGVFGNESFMFDDIHANAAGNLLFARRVSEFLWGRKALKDHPDSDLTIPPVTKVEFQKYDPPINGHSEQRIKQHGAKIRFTVGFLRSGVSQDKIKLQLKLKIREHGWTLQHLTARIIQDFQHGYYLFEADLPDDVDEYMLRASYDGKDDLDPGKFFVWSNREIKVIRDNAMITPQNILDPKGGIDLSPELIDQAIQNSLNLRDEDNRIPRMRFQLSSYQLE